MIFQPQKKSPSASETEEGLMSAADKKKLNGIASGANAYTHPTYSTKSSGLYKVTVDSTGHISAATAVTKSDITALGIPASDTDTHYTSKNVVGSSTATSNTTSALTNGNVYLNSVENGTVTSAHKISGSGATTVTTDANGNIIISSTDTNTNTTYTAGTGLSLSGTTFNHSNSVTAGTAQGDASKTLTFGGTFTIPTVTYDAQGHITGKGTTTMTMPANPNTDTKVTNTLATTTKAYVTGTTSATTNTGTQVFDTGVYLDTTAGMLTATTFKGALSGNASTASRTVDGGTHAETASGTDANAPTTGMLFSSGLFMTQTYNDAATPVSYGNIINLAGSGTGQLLCEWSGNDNTLGHLYYRSHRDTSTGGWSSWGKVAFTTDTVSAATKATQDSAGQQINTTYIKGLSISGTTITITKGDGSTSTVTTQDTNTTYTANTGIKLNGTTFQHTNAVTAGTAQGDASKTLTFGGTFTIPTVTYDAQGHITGKGTTKMTMPANPNTWRGIQNNLTSDSTTDSLSAAQGKVLKGLVDGKAAASHSHNYAGSSSAGGSATSAVSVVDYGDSSKTIKIGFAGEGATTSNLGHIAGYLSGGTQIKDVSKDTLKSWLGLGSAAYTSSNAYATASHTHSYAGASSSGGSATSAVKLDSSAGSATQPVYFSGGKPVATTYTLGASVPSGAKFTDTTYSAMTGATSSAAGKSGLVPAPAAGDQEKFLRADGTWQKAGGNSGDCLPLTGGVVSGNVQQSGGTTDYTTYKFRNIGFGTTSTPTSNSTYGGNGSIYFQYS